MRDDDFYRPPASENGGLNAGDRKPVPLLLLASTSFLVFFLGLVSLVLLGLIANSLGGGDLVVSTALLITLGVVCFMAHRIVSYFLVAEGKVPLKEHLPRYVAHFLIVTLSAPCLALLILFALCGGFF